MSYRQLAEHLNYGGYAATIAAANGAEPDTEVAAGATVNIPPLYFEIPETAWNGMQPSPESLLGSLYPNLLNPTLKFKPDKVDWLLRIAEIAAFAAILCVAPELFGGWLFGGSLANLAAWEVGTSYGLAGALGSGVSQGMEMEFGQQKEFNFKLLALEAATAAITAGLMKGMKLPANMDMVPKVATNIGKAEILALGRQALRIAANQQHGFKLSQMVAAAVQGVVNVGLEDLEPVSQGILGTTLDAVGGALINHQRLNGAFAAEVAANLVGTAIGNAGHDYLLQQQTGQSGEVKAARSVQREKSVSTTNHGAIKHDVIPQSKRDKRRATADVEISEMKEERRELAEAILPLASVTGDQIRNAPISRAERWNGDQASTFGNVSAASGDYFQENVVKPLGEAWSTVTDYEKLKKVGGALGELIESRIDDQFHAGDPIVQNKMRQETGQQWEGTKRGMHGFFDNIIKGGAREKTTAGLDAASNILALTPVGKLLGTSKLLLFAGRAKKVGGSAQHIAKIEKTIQKIEDYMGEGMKVTKPGIKRKSDLILTSADGTKKIRFDIKNSHGLDPHVNVETFKPRNGYPGDKAMIKTENYHVFPKNNLEDKDLYKFTK